MAEFTTNPRRFDPYKNFRFKVKWDNRYVAGVSRVSGLTRTTEVVTYRAGGELTTTHKSPGQTSYSPITLERGVTHDLEFERWANKIWDYPNSQNPNSSGTISLADFRKAITLELYNEAGQVVLAYNIYRCWPSEFQALPDLDANASAVAIQRLTLENEGWDRDVSVVEPQEPSYDDPALA